MSLDVALGTLRLPGYRAQIVAQLVVLHLRRLHAGLRLSQSGIQFGEPLGGSVSLLRRRGVIHGILGSFGFLCKVLVLTLCVLERTVCVCHIDLQADAVGIELVECLLQVIHITRKRLDRLLHAVDGGREIVLRRHHNANIWHSSSPLSVLDLLQGHRPQDDALAPRDSLKCGGGREIVLRRHHNANIWHSSSPLSVLDLLQGHRPQDDALAPRDSLKCGRQHMMMLEKVVHQVCVAALGQFFCTSSTSSTVLRW